MLPKKDGTDVLEGLRREGVKTPVLILTARDSINDKVMALDLGADDYLTKPFSFLELCARIRALLRRGKVETETKLRLDDLELDLVSHQVTRGGDVIPLTSKEFSLLEFFMRNPNRILTRTIIAEHVWDYRFNNITSNVMDVLVNRLRNKIDKGSAKKLIHTIKGVGYSLQG
jgi:DNA-binding response OmpR family regulator